MIRLSKVEKSFAGFRVLKDVSFEVKKGGITAFLGVNGAGKTTTMRIIDGIITADSGQVQVGNYSPSTNPVEVKRMIGYLPEDNPLYLNFRVSEYLGFVAHIRQVDGFPTKFFSLFKQMGIADVWDKKITTLSHGYKQRVGLTAALLHQPKVLILDEPLSGLDPLQKVEIMELLEKISRKTTILFSTHVLPEVEKLCQQVIIIHRGEIKFSGSLTQLGEGGTIEVTYQGQKKVIKKLVENKKLHLLRIEPVKRNQWRVQLKTSSKRLDSLLKQLSTEITSEGGVVLGLKTRKGDLSTFFNSLVKDENRE